MDRMNKVSIPMKNYFGRGGQLSSPWDNLSIREKADMMKVAVRNGITDLSTIKSKYNEFAEGGEIEPPVENSNIYAGGSYLDIAKQHIKKNEGWLAKPYRDAPKGKNWRSVGYGFNDSGFRNKYPQGISNHYEKGITKAQAEEELNWFLGGVVNHLKKVYGRKWDSFNDNQKAAIIDTYYQRPASVVGKGSQFYRAVMAGDKNAGNYLGVAGYGNRNKDRRKLFGASQIESVAPTQEVLPISEPIQSVPEETVDFIPWNPQAFFGTNNNAPIIIQQEAPVVEEKIPTPEEIERQERQQGLANFQTIMGLLNNTSDNTSTTLTPFESTVSMLTQQSPIHYFSDGGSIFIRPENRGKFTALKERTGHSATWFKEHGTPAQKKMATFALNSRHWKHGLGGNLFEFGGESDNNPRIITTGGAGYIPPVQSENAIDDVLSAVSKKVMNYIKGAHDTGSYFSYDPSMEAYTGPAQDTYLLPRKLQEKEFLRRGYIKGKDKDYGLVKRAVGNRDLPVYQRNPDAITRDNLTVIGNIEGWDPWYGSADTALEHPGSYPTAVYTDGEGNFYQKGWDLNDYGGKTGSTIGVLSDIVDRVGSPTVVTTGYQPVKDSQSERFIQEITPMMAKKGLVPTDVNGITEWTLPEVTVTGKKKRKKKALGGNLFEGGGDTKAGIPVDYLDPSEVMPLVANNPNKSIVLDEVVVTPSLNPNQRPIIEVSDALKVERPVIEPFKPVDLSESGAVNRAVKVYSNYSEAKDNPLTYWQEGFYNSLRSLKDNVWNGIPSGVSNCTLSASQWVDPTNPIKSAASIVGNPNKYGYSKITDDSASIGNLVIAKNPDNDTYHTMMIEGFANNDGMYTYKGKTYPTKKGEPLVAYSTGGHDIFSLRRGIPLSVYTANSDGHTENLFFKYNYPKYSFLKK